jgi:hypothetical protein
MIITYGGSMSHPLFTPSSAATSRGRRLLAAVLAPIAMLALAFSISSTTAFGEVGVTQQGNDEEVMDTQTTGIEMPVRPWCGWIALTGANTPIALVPAAGQETTYDGDAITLEAVGQEYGIKVAPVDQATTADLASFTEEAEDACSWFASSEVNGVDVSTTLSGNTFTAVSDKNTLNTPDDSMDFTTNDGLDQNLVIDNTPATCADAGFSFDNNPFRVTTSQIALDGTNVVSMLAIDTLTNSYCSWTSDYTVTIPSEKKPIFGNSTYTYTGPTVTNTMVYGRP